MFIGPMKIDRVEDTEHEHLVKITYVKPKNSTKDAEWEIMNRDLMEASQTEKAIDWSTFSRKKLEYVAERVISLMLHFNLKDMEIRPLTDLVLHSVDNNVRRANRFLWKRESEIQLDDLDNRTMQMVQDVLVSHGKESKPDTKE